MFAVLCRAAGASKALNASQSALAQVNVKVDDYLSTIHNAGVGAVVCVTLMSILITLMSGARTCLEKAVDEKGRPRLDNCLAVILRHLPSASMQVGTPQVCVLAVDRR